MHKVAAEILHFGCVVQTYTKALTRAIFCIPVISNSEKKYKFIGNGL